MLEKDPDGINLQTAKMLLKDLGLRMEDILPSRLVAPSPIPRDNRSAQTASRTVVDSIRSLGGGTSVHDVHVSHFNPMPVSKQGFVI